MSRRTSLGVQAVVLLLVGLSFRLPGLGQDAAGDELYHVLAARSYLADGTLSINGGAAYERSLGFTLLVAGLFRLCGDSLVVARLPAVLAGSLVPVLVFLWLAADDRRTAAWLAGLLLAFDPMGVILADQARFYTLHELFFVVACLGVYALVRGDRAASRSAVIAVGVVLALLAAGHLQDSTKVGIAALGIYVLLARGATAWRWVRQRPARSWLVVAGALTLGLLAPFLAQLVDVESSLQLATHADPWAAGSVHAWRFYGWILESDYPALWTFFPVLLLVAAASHARATFLAASVFGVTLLVHSLLAWKAERYIQYSTPFFFAICGLGLAGFGAVLRSAAERVAQQTPWLGRVSRGGQAVMAATLAASAVFFLAGTPALTRTVHILSRDPRMTHPGMESGTMSWSRASTLLAPVVARSEVVLSTDDTKALYYLGRLDYVIDWDHLHQWGMRDEFMLDTTMNAPIVTTPESLARIRACHASGLIVAQTWSLETDWKVPPPTADFIHETFERISVPEEWGIRAFRWETPSPAREGCPPQSR